MFALVGIVYIINNIYIYIYIYTVMRALTRAHITVLSAVRASVYSSTVQQVTLAHLSA
jgi:hypothetical protein